MKWAQVKTFTEWTQVSSQYQDMNIEYRLIGSLSVNLVKVDLPVSENYDPPVHSLNFQIPLVKSCFAYISFGDKVFECGGKDRSMCVAPSFATCRYDILSPSPILFIDLPAQPLLAYFETMTGSATTDLGVLHDEAFHDAYLETLGRTLWQEATDQSTLDLLFIDHTAYTLLAALLKRAGRVQKQHLQHFGLSKQQFQKLTDYINDHLAETLSLNQLADTLRLTTWELTRAFKKTTGLAPYSFLSNVRIERAKELLKDSNLPIAQIALEVGFSSQSHLNSAFKKFQGCTPGQFRRHNT
jgi:AraC-like DNA-binding protein